MVDVPTPVQPPHANATIYSHLALMYHFPGVEVGQDLMMRFSEPGVVGQSRLAPDVFVALKVPRHGGRCDYDADRLGPPDFVLEVLSASTWKHDVGRKLDCYQQIGVRECLLFDAAGEDRAGTGKALWGFAMTPERREPLAEVELPNGDRGVASAVLGLVAHVVQRTPPSAPDEIWALAMRWHDPATGADIPDYDEALATAQAARARAEAARTRADVARRGLQAPRIRADAESARADAEIARADAARRETQAARRRIAELEEQIRLMGEGD